MNFRALLIVLSLAALVTIVWPPEVMSPTQLEVASDADDSGEGRLMDLNTFELAKAEGPPVEQAPPEMEAPQEGDLRGRDYGSLTRQGEILAHTPSLMEAYIDNMELHPGRERFLETCAHLALDLPGVEKIWVTVSEEDPVSSVERSAVIRHLSSGEGGAAVPASSQGFNAVVRGLEMARMRVELRRVLSERDYSSACGVLSELIEDELTADWNPHIPALTDWAKQLNEAQGFHRWNKRGEWPSLEYVVRPGDSLVEIRKRVIAERPELNLCTGLIARSNQLRNPNSIQPGQRLRIPLDPVHTMVDLSARFLLYYHGEEVVCAWPVTIGREGKTIPGEYNTGQKKEEPMWFPQGRDPVPFGEPENPLGTRWIAWDGSNGLGFHGTSEEDMIGKEASDGCIRLRNRDVEELFEIVPVGSQIVVQP